MTKLLSPHERSKPLESCSTLFSQSEPSLRSLYEIARRLRWDLTIGQTLTTQKKASTATFQLLISIAFFSTSLWVRVLVCEINLQLRRTTCGARFRTPASCGPGSTVASSMSVEFTCRTCSSCRMKTSRTGCSCRTNVQRNDNKLKCKALTSLGKMISHRRRQYGRLFRQLRVTSDLESEKTTTCSST